MHSCEVIRPSVRRLEGLGNRRPETLLMASRAAFERAPLHVLLLSTSHIMRNEAMYTFPQWMSAAAHALSQ